jgi:hypothetical protein
MRLRLGTVGGKVAGESSFWRLLWRYSPLVGYTASALSEVASGVVRLALGRGFLLSARL